MWKVVEWLRYRIIYKLKEENGATNLQVQIMINQILPVKKETTVELNTYIWFLKFIIHHHYYDLNFSVESWKRSIHVSSTCNYVDTNSQNLHLMLYL